MVTISGLGARTSSHFVVDRVTERAITFNIIKDTIIKKYLRVGNSLPTIVASSRYCKLCFKVH